MKNPFLLLALFVTFSLGIGQAQETTFGVASSATKAKPSSKALLEKEVMPTLRKALPAPPQSTRVLFECEHLGGFTAGPYTDQTWIIQIQNGNGGFQLGVRYFQYQDFSNWPQVQTVTELYLKVIDPLDTLDLFLTATAIPTNWVPTQSLGQFCDIPATRLAYNDQAQETLLRYECGPATLPPASPESLAFRDVFAGVKTDITQNPDLFLNW